VFDVYPKEKRDEILRLAAIAEVDSNHPIAKSIVSEYNKEIEKGYTLLNITGKGVVAKKDENIILCGNHKLMEEYNIPALEIDNIGTIVHVAYNNEYLGYIVIADEIKEEAYTTIKYLNSIGARTIMLTGDNEKIALHVAKELGLTEFNANLLPVDKVLKVDAILGEKKDNELLCFVGDGINDAPVLMKSDIGISMGGVGSDAAIEASDIVLMHDDLGSIEVAKKIARKTMRIVYENIVFALFIKIVILVLSALGITNMWIAVFGDVGVAILCILNAMRANTKEYK